MKKIVYIFGILLLLQNISSAQEIHVDRLNFQRNQINRYAMITLGSWAVGNMAVNGVLYRSGEKDRKYFYQMNMAWNVVNLAIAGFGLYGALHPDTSPTLFEAIMEQSNIEKILLFNAGLDVAYMMTGFHLKERAKNTIKHHDRLKGYGNSLVLQGGFLLAFDMTVYFIQAGNHELIKKLLEHMSVAPGSISIVLNF